MFVEDTQNPRGIILANQGRNKPPRWIEPNCVYPVIKKLMMMQLNASGVLAGNVRFVLRLALNSTGKTHTKNGCKYTQYL